MSRCSAEQIRRALLSDEDVATRVRGGRRVVEPPGVVNLTAPARCRTPAPGRGRATPPAAADVPDARPWSHKARNRSVANDSVVHEAGERSSSRPPGRRRALRSTRMTRDGVDPASPRGPRIASADAADLGGVNASSAVVVKRETSCGFRVARLYPRCAGVNARSRRRSSDPWSETATSRSSRCSLDDTESTRIGDGPLTSQILMALPPPCHVCPTSTCRRYASHRQLGRIASGVRSCLSRASRSRPFWIGRRSRRPRRQRTTGRAAEPRHPGKRRSVRLRLSPRPEVKRAWCSAACGVSGFAGDRQQPATPEDAAAWVAPSAATP